MRFDQASERTRLTSRLTPAAAAQSDLLPKGTDQAAVVEWVRERAEGRRLTVAGVQLVSSRTGAGMERALAAVLRERRGRAVYVVGVANVGKSTFVRAFLSQFKQVKTKTHLRLCAHLRRLAFC